MEQQCLEFFSPKRIRKYLALYWEIWHPNTNFIHRSTFDPMSCNMGLMAAMVLIGKQGPVYGFNIIQPFGFLL